MECVGVMSFLNHGGFSLTRKVAIKEQEVKIRYLFNWALSFQGRSNQSNAEVLGFLEELM